MARITDERNWLKTPLTVTCTIVTGRHLHLVRQAVVEGKKPASKSYARSESTRPFLFIKRNSFNNY
jgi:hypothetical protein